MNSITNAIRRQEAILKRESTKCVGLRVPSSSNRKKIWLSAVSRERVCNVLRTLDPSNSLEKRGFKVLEVAESEGTNPGDLLNLARRLLEKAADPKSDSDEKIAAARKGFDELRKQLLHSGLLQESPISNRQQPQSELSDLLKTISLVLQDHPDKSLDELLDLALPPQEDDLITRPSLIVSGAAILLAIIATGLASLQHSFMVSTYALTFAIICSIVSVTARIRNVDLWLATGFLGCFSAATMLLARCSENQETAALGIGLRVASYILIYEACFLTSLVLSKK